MMIRLAGCIVITVCLISLIHKGHLYMPICRNLTQSILKCEIIFGNKQFML